MSSILFFFFLVFTQSYGDLGVIFVRQTKEESWVNHYCTMYNPSFHSLPSTADKAMSYPLTDVSDDLGCHDSTIYDKVKVSGTVVAVSRGNCTFVEKGSVAESHQAKGVIVISDHLLTPASNDSDPVHIPVLIVRQSDYKEIMSIGKNLEVKAYAPNLKDDFDPNLVIIFLLAVGCLTVGGYWSGIKKHEKSLQLKVRKKRRGSADRSEDENEDEEDEGDDQETVNLTLPAIAIFVVMSSTVLVLLFFFYDYLVYIIIGMFCLAGSAGLYACILPLWNRIPLNARLPKNRVPCFSHRPHFKNMLLAALCLGFAIFWLVERKSSYSWILQNILGIAFCINFLCILRMPNIKICAVLLVALFIYDIFFVFITPLITPSGKSIMVDVATGASSHTGEQLPMVFKVPKLTSSPLNVCYLSPSLLGFGDVMVPGLLAAYNHGIDLKVKSYCKIYFLTTVIGYSVGLIFTFIALYLMASGQPALLYLVPCTLIPTIVIGCCRGEMRVLWTGEMKCPKKDDDERGERPVSNTTQVVVDDDGSISSDCSENRVLLDK